MRHNNSVVLFRPPPPSFEMFQYSIVSETQKITLPCLSVLWENKFSTKIRESLPRFIHNIFRYQKSSETQKVSSTKCFPTVRQNKFDRKSWYSSPLSHIKSTDIRIFLIIRRVLLRKVSVLWDRTISTETRKRRPSPHLLEIFQYGKPSEPQKLFSTSVSLLWDVTNARYSSTPPPSFIHKSFPYYKICETQKATPRSDSLLWDTKSQRQIVILPSPFYPQNLSIPDCFRTTEGFPYETLRYCETEQFWQKITWLLSPPHLWTVWFFDTRKIPKLRSVPLKIVSLLWGDKIPHAESW